MDRIKNWIRKDRYGIVRGTLLLGIVMLLCTGMVIQLFYSYDQLSEEERASEVTMRVTAQFEQMIDNSLIQLMGSAELIDETQLVSEEILERLMKFDTFSDVAVLKGGILTYADGSTERMSEYESHIRYVSEFVDAEILAGEDGQIHLCVPMKAGARLVGWLNQDKLESVLCNAFVEDYGYAVYNAATGAYVINHTPLGDDSYFEALRDLNLGKNTEQLVNAGDAQVYIEHSDAIGGDYYIAQQLSKIRPLGIALIIPKELVRSEAWSGRIMPHATILAAALMLVILISYTVFSLRRVYLSNKNANRALAIGERMMDVISNEANITLFTYQRKLEKLVNCYDGLSLLRSEGHTYLHTLSEIEEACGMDDSETERLHETLRLLEPGESSEILVHAASENHDECILRFMLFASSQPEQGIICCISDCTQEQASLDRIELERSYQASVQEKASSIWQINISRNRWKPLHIKKQSALYGLMFNQDEWRDYNADLGSLLREYLHPADYAGFAESMSIVGIASRFRSSKTEFTQDYRVCRGNGADYEWHRMSVRIWLNPENNDILANLYVFNVNAEKNAELERGERKKVLHQTLMALGGLYYGLYYVDLDNDLSYAARSLDGDLVTQLCTPYKATFDGYIDSAVHPDDREGLRSLLSAYQLRKRMTEGSHFIRREYRRKSGDSYEQAAIIVQPARFENGIVKEVVLAIRYIGRDKDLEM